MKPSAIRPPIQPGRSPPAPEPAPAARARRLAVGSVHRVLDGAPRTRPVASWRDALWIGGAVTIPAVLVVAALVIAARAAGPFAAELVARSWPLLVPLALALTSSSALLALRHAARRPSDGVPSGEVRETDR